MSKSRVVLRLNDDEIVVVGSRDRWEHLVTVYEAFANDPFYIEEPGWADAADWIKSWLARAEPKSEGEEW